VSGLRQTLLRPVLAAVCGLSVIYDLAAVSLQKLKRLDPGVVRERRSERRGFIDTQAGLDVLSHVRICASQTGAKVFLVSGTLLGLHRSGKLLDHDYDIDVGVSAGDPALPAFLESIRHIPGHIGEKTISLSATDCALNPWLGLKPADAVLYKHFFRPPGTSGRPFGIDVFVHFNANGFCVHGNYRCLWINRPFALREHDFGSLRFLAPEDTNLYLSENYGDYTIENRSFESSVDCPNTTNLYGFRAAMWLTGRYAYFIATRDPAKRAIIAARLWDYIRYGLLFQGEPRWQLNQYHPCKLDPKLDSAKPPR
jgi:hypothetical protein